MDTLKILNFKLTLIRNVIAFTWNYLEGIVDICDPEFGIRPTDTTINMCKNATTKPVVVIDLVCMRNKYCPVLQFYVLDGPELRNKPPLMCGTDCELLNIVRLNVYEISSLAPCSISHHFQTLHYCLSNSFSWKTFIFIFHAFFSSHAQKTPFIWFSLVVCFQG